MDPRRSIKVEAPQECLICSQNVYNCPDAPPTPHHLLPGAVNCQILGKQLEQMFILLEILDFPGDWCEELLKGEGRQRYDEEDDEGGASEGSDNNPETWFWVCPSCLSHTVYKALEMHQQTLMLKSQLKELKLRVRNTMKENWDWKQERTGRIDDEIRKLVCISQDDVNIEEEDNCSVNIQLEAVELTDEFSQVVKRKRGRPKGSFKKKEVKVKVRQKRSISIIPEANYYENDSNSSFSDCGGDDPDWGGGGMEVDDLDEEFIDNEGEDKVEEEEGSDIFSIPAPPLRRKRGRPKGSTNKKGKQKRSSSGKRKEDHKSIYHTCPKCPSRFVLTENLKLHLEAHSKCESGRNQFTCTVCSFPSLSVEELQFHTKAKHSDWKKPRAGGGHNCSLCPFKIGKLKLLLDHYLEKHQDQDSSELDLLLPKECTACGKFYPDAESLTLHEQRIHPELCGNVEDKPIQCDQCEQQFSSRFRLQSHMKNTHDRVNRHVCDECGAGFQFLSRLTHHKIKHDKGKREWVCHLCGVDYPYERTLVSHYKNVHPDYEQNSHKKQEESEVTGGGFQENQFKCKHCNLTSPFRVVITRHLATHKEELGHKCQICSKLYFNAQGLKRHIRINHPTTNEKVECPYCKKEYPDPEYLRGHLRLFCKVKQLEESSGGGTNANTTTSSTLEQSVEAGMKVELEQYGEGIV